VKHPIVRGAVAMVLALAAPAAAKPSPKKPKPSPAPAPTPAVPPQPGDLPENPTRNDILVAMARVKPRVRDCFDHHQTPGTVVVKLVVTSSGRVASATASGELAGTPTAECVEGAVRGAVFRSFRRERVTITYPFVLKKDEE